jgi:hypothetical protein
MAMELRRMGSAGVDRDPMKAPSLGTSRKGECPRAGAVCLTTFRPGTHRWREEVL